MLVRMNLGIAMALIVSSAALADLSISNKATHDVICSGGVCTATAKGANLNVTDLTNMLAAGDTTVKFGGGALAIQINDGFSWTSASRLTIDANTSVGFHKPVTVAGQGALTITYNDGSTDGDLKFVDEGKIDFWDSSSGLSINGKSYALITDLASLAARVKANSSDNIALAIDVDAGGDTSGKVPVKTLFSGIFEGLGHSVQNLHLSKAVRCKDGGNGICEGLFAAVKGTVRDIAVDASILVPPRAFSGALAGEMVNGAIVNSSSSGSIVASEFGAVGGLVGRSPPGGVITNSHSSVNVTAGVVGTIAGGLVGGDPVTDDGPMIFHSFATGTVGGPGFYVGGLAGTGRASNSYATGDVAGNAIVGGLIGNAITVESSFAIGNVSASPSGGTAGGLVGVADSIAGSFALGNVRGNCVGGLAGGISEYFDRRIVNNYSLGAVTTTDGGAAGGLVGIRSSHHRIDSSNYSAGKVTVESGVAKTGGLVGEDLHGDWESSYWDLDTSGQSRAFGKGKEDNAVVGLSDVQLKSGLPDGFDPKIWGQSPNINNGYPYLLANPPQQ